MLFVAGKKEFAGFVGLESGVDKSDNGAEKRPVSPDKLLCVKENGA